MKEFKPIAMRCNQQQYDEIKQILIDNGFKCSLDDIFENYPYLTNNYNAINKYIKNVSNDTKTSFNRTVFETWNKDTFLEYCGIETSNNQNNKTEFIVGKWYKYGNQYTKFSKIENDLFLGTEHIYDGKHQKRILVESWIFVVNNNIKLLTDLSEIQQYLPDRHVDKQNNKVNMNDILEEAKRRYPVGTKFKPIRSTGEISDNIVLQEKECYLYKDNENYEWVIGSANIYNPVINKWAKIIESPITQPFTNNKWIPQVGDWVMSKNTTYKNAEQIVGFHDDDNMSLKGREISYCNINNYRKAEPHEIPTIKEQKQQEILNEFMSNSTGLQYIDTAIGKTNQPTTNNKQSINQLLKVKLN